jgi:hypothetical protein
VSFPANLAKHRRALLDILAESSQDPGRRTALKTRGVSMAPLVRERDEVAIQALAPERIAVGDLLAFRAGDVVLVHRVVAIDRALEPPVYYEKGDNNLYLTPVTPERILGVVVEVVAGGRRLDLRAGRFVWLGRAVAAYGRRSVPLYAWLRRIGQQVLRPGSAPSRCAREVARALVQLPPRLALGAARRVF